MTQPWTMDDAVSYGRHLLRGERVSLRESHEDDYEQLARWWADPGLSVLQTNWVRPAPATTVSDMMRAWNANVGDDAGFTIVENGPDGQDLAEARVIGQLNLFGVTKNRSALLGIVLGPDHWGTGLGSEAVRLAVRYGFEEMGLHRIGLGVYAYNERGIRAYEKAGFREEGRRRETVFHAGRWHDEVMMGLLEDEWRASSP